MSNCAWTAFVAPLLLFDGFMLALKAFVHIAEYWSDTRAARATTEEAL